MRSFDYLILLGIKLSKFKDSLLIFLGFLDLNMLLDEVLKDSKKDVIEDKLGVIKYVKFF